MTDKLAVFVSDRPRGREAKLAYGLQSAGWRVVLLHDMVPTFNVGAYFVEVRRYQSCEEAVALARGYSPVVYHVFSNWVFDVAGALIRARPGKIVFDDYDVMAGMLDERDIQVGLGRVEAERFCLENADGLCCRSLETQYAKRHMGYKYPRRIFFPDSCWNISDPPVKQPVVDGYLNAAAVGNLYVNQHMPVGHPVNYHLELALRLAQYKIRSFLYLSAACATVTSKEALESLLGGNLDVHVGHLSYEQLIYALQSQCHVGLACLPRLDTPGLEAEPYRQTKREHALGNKLFDYIDAAIPVVSDAPTKFMYWFARRYHKVFDFDAFIADLNGHRGQIQDLLTNHVEELSRARKILSVRRQIGRLIEFYGNL